MSLTAFVAGIVLTAAAEHHFNKFEAEWKTGESFNTPAGGGWGVSSERLQYRRMAKHRRAIAFGSFSVAALFGVLAHRSVPCRAPSVRTDIGDVAPLYDRPLLTPALAIN